MTTPYSDLPRTLDLWLKQGADLVESCTWTAATAPVDFAGAAARLVMQDDCGSVVWTLTTTASAYGSIYLGSASTGDVGVFRLTFTKLLTQTLRFLEYPYDLYIDWANGTTTALLTGTLHVQKGSPF